jgi:hypothetical protein
MSFTPSEHQSMLRRAHAAVEQRDRTRTRHRRATLVCALVLAVGAAALIAWPRSPRGAASPAPQMADVSNDSPPAPPPAANDTFVAPDWLLPPTKQLVAALPAWAEIIDSDEELEAGFTAAGQCARVVRVDHRIVMVACSDLTPLPQVPAQ